MFPPPRFAHGSLGSSLTLSGATLAAVCPFVLDVVGNLRFRVAPSPENGSEDVGSLGFLVTLDGSKGVYLYPQEEFPCWED